MTGASTGITIATMRRSIMPREPEAVGRWTLAAERAGADSRREWIVAVLDAAASGAWIPKGFLVHVETPGGGGWPKLVSVAVDEDTAAAWDAAAEACGMSPNRWACTMLDSACGQSALVEQLARLRLVRRPGARR